MKKRLHFGFFTALVCIGFTSCANVGRQVGREVLEGAGARAGGQIAGSRASATVVKTALSGAAGFVVTVRTANGMYEIYGDCRTGLEQRSADVLTESERVSIVRDLCSGNVR